MRSHTIRFAFRHSGLFWPPRWWACCGSPRCCGSWAPRRRCCPTPPEYFRVYFGGVSTIILYNMCMAIMQALGDSIRPLFYLLSPGWTGTNRQRPFENHKKDASTPPTNCTKGRFRICKDFQSLKKTLQSGTIFSILV